VDAQRIQIQKLRHQLAQEKGAKMLLAKEKSKLERRVLAAKRKEQEAEAKMAEAEELCQMAIAVRLDGSGGGGGGVDFPAKNAWGEEQPVNSSAEGASSAAAATAAAAADTATAATADAAAAAAGAAASRESPVPSEPEEAGVGLPDQLGPFSTAAVQRVSFISADSESSSYWFPETATGIVGRSGKSSSSSSSSSGGGSSGGGSSGGSSSGAASGVLSPCTPLTLPPERKEKLQIAQSAVEFAFAYPLAPRPAEVSHEASARSRNSAAAERPADERGRGLLQGGQSSTHSGAPSCTQAQQTQLLLLPADAERKFVLLGGFVYFDGAGRVVSVTAISGDAPCRKRDEHLVFDGPYHWPEEWSTQLAAERVHAITLPALRALGLCGFAWLLPNESFVLGATGAAEDCCCPHGGFVYFFEKDYRKRNKKNRSAERRLAGCGGVIVAARELS
jgi:hypothetical protein